MRFDRFNHLTPKARLVLPFVAIRNQGEAYRVGLNILMEQYFEAVPWSAHVWSGFCFYTPWLKFRWRYSRAQRRHLISLETPKP